jgi:glycosyltransferase involved in cell wall biosynthesis
VKIIHYVPRINEEASGLTGAVPPLCIYLASLSHEVKIFCLAARGPIAGVKLQVFPIWPVLLSFGFSPALVSAMRHDLGKVDVVHNHSLWTMPNIAAGWLVPGSQSKLVTSPHGTLSAWALNRKRFLKWMIWPFQKRAISRADMVHVTSELELMQLRNLGITVPVALIPLGIEMPALSIAEKPTHIDDQRTLLYLSRIHPIKGIDRLLASWKILQQKHPSWRLVIAGTGDARHVAEIREMAVQLELCRVEFPGALYGALKEAAYQAADLFVLPTHSENFGLVVAEALANGCPALVSRGAPWPGLDKERCGWWIENEVNALTTALNHAMQLPRNDLRYMGLRGRAWMERDFSWASSAQKMDAAYRWLVTGGDRPEWVKVCETA